MKTVFITSFHALISRNILMAGVPALLANTHRVVLLVPQEKVSYFADEFGLPAGKAGGGEIIVEGVDTTLTRRDRLLRYAVLAITRTKGLAIKRRAKYAAGGNLLSYIGSALPSALLRGARPVVAALRFFDPLVLRSRRFAPLFAKYQPALVFATDLQNEMDVRLLEEAKARGVATAGMIRSWDNVSSKGLLRAVPALVVVHNESLKRQMIEKNFIPADTIAVVGIPHYDRYAEPAVTVREDFFAPLGLDKNRKLVLFAPIGDRYIRDNKLDALILETLSHLDVNVLVRLPPTDTIAYLPVPNNRAHIVVQKTGDRPWKNAHGGGASKLNEITRQDEQTLIDSLYYADVLVTGQSTMVIDAAAFDTPSIIIDFDTEPREYYDSMHRYYDYEYYPPVIQSGGVFVARSPEELRILVESSLTDRALGHDGRMRLFAEQAGELGGGSAERLVEALRSAIYS